MGETYYEVLGVNPDATTEEIERAYRRRAFEVHPDRNDDPDATEQFKRLSTAESVLSDDRERARYDRLGHESYRRLARLSNGTDGEPDREDGGRDDADGSRSSGSGDRGSTRDDRGSNRSRRQQRRRTSHAGSRQTSAGVGSSRAGTGRARSGFDATNVGSSATGFDSSATGSGPSATGSASSAAETGAGAAGQGDRPPFHYAVHDWADEVDLDPSTRSMDRHTLVVVSCTALLYPMFVYASLSPFFPLPINALVAACTLAFAGYLLTMPKVAIRAFGCWGLLVPYALVELPVFDPLSLHGLFAIAFVWVPLGYAVAFRWALRP